MENSEAVKEFNEGYEYALHVLRELGVDVDNLLKKV